MREGGLQGTKRKRSARTALGSEREQARLGGRKRNREGEGGSRNEKEIGRDIFLESCGREIESTVGQPTAGTRPLHYAHRSLDDFNVPLEMVDARSRAEGTHVVKPSTRNY